MTKPRRGGALVLLVLISATCGWLADRWLAARSCVRYASPSSSGTPALGAMAIPKPASSTPMWVCNRTVPVGKPLGASVVASAVTAVAGPEPGRATRSVSVSVWAGDRLIADRTGGGYVVFVDFAPNIPLAALAWPREKAEGLAAFYDRAVLSYYTGVKGFDDLEAWSEAFGISLEAPILLFYDPQHPQDPQPTATWYAGQVPVITYGPTIRTQTASHGLRLAVHELAHIWDGAHNWTLSDGLVQAVQNPANYPTARARDGGPLEDFAESVTAYLIDGYASNERWSDDDQRFYQRIGVEPDEVWVFDRYDYVARLFAGATVTEICEEADALYDLSDVTTEDGTVVPDR